jgi:hypothetical protein
MSIIELYARPKRDAVEWTPSQYAVQAPDWTSGSGLFSVLVEGRSRRNSALR